MLTFKTRPSMRATSSAFIPNSPARQALAARFGLPYFEGLQDWEWEVADGGRFQEFVNAYRTLALPVEQRASLMEMLIQCVEDATTPSDFAARWSEVEPLLISGAALHGPSITYWAILEETDPAATFRVSSRMRRLRDVVCG